jgi:glucosyl-3-phosphoglycerate synthase
VTLLADQAVKASRGPAQRNQPRPLTVAACLPARNEAATIAGVVRVCRQLQDIDVLAEVVGVVDHAEDRTAEAAHRAGATVVSNQAGPGKGEALRCAIDNTSAEVLVFLDADVTNFSAHFVTGLIAPLIDQADLQLVKAAYRRPLHGRPDEGGRVTELVARPLLERFYPELADIDQPLAGECAVRRGAVAGVTLAGGYGIEIGLLIDLYLRHGRGAIAQAHLGQRIHRNRPLHELKHHSRAVIDAVLARADGPDGGVPEMQPAIRTPGR